MKMIESSKKKIAPEIHLMTRQKEQIYLVCMYCVDTVTNIQTSAGDDISLSPQRGKDLQEVQAWKRALVEAKRSSNCPTSVR